MKGTGVAPDSWPICGDHTNGVLFLREAIEELIIQRLVEAVMSFLGLDVRGVALCALILTGFGARHEPGGTLVPCALLVRTAHRRPSFQPPPSGSEEQRAVLQIELLLRCFGMSTCDKGNPVVFYRDSNDVPRVVDPPSSQAVVSASGTLFEPTTAEIEDIWRQLGFPFGQVKRWKC